VKAKAAEKRQRPRLAAPGATEAPQTNVNMLFPKHLVCWSQLRLMAMAGRAAASSGRPAPWKSRETKQELAIPTDEKIEAGKRPALQTLR
jgi:hypothetical protein